MRAHIGEDTIWENTYESTYMKAQWEHTYESTHMRAHIWEHNANTYMRAHRGEHTHECTHMSAHIWEHRGEHTYESTHMRAHIWEHKRSTHMKAHIWEHIGEHTYEPVQPKGTWTCHKSHSVRKFQEKYRTPIPGTAFCARLRSRNAHGHFRRAILCGNLHETCRTTFCARLPGEHLDWTPGLQSGHTVWGKNVNDWRTATGNLGDVTFQIWDFHQLK